MPFKLKLKKTRQYNVASKSLFVISVELLDGGVADCTLSVDSSGQECLDNVCQRQAINQPEFFGLRYADRGQQPRWVQLDRPLKRQLDKNASSHQLHLRVMYYVISGTSLITDEVTRYHYFLQLKNDLVEGRIICDCQQAVVLASYSRQAEYGNHDRERHTVEYLKNLLTFPKQILDGGQIIDGSTLAETGKLEYLTAAVIQHHMALHNMSQAQAEEGFITTCQQLRGYGQEMFAARSQRDQTEATIAISLTGIKVFTETSDSPHFYRWMDITNVINHKRTFSIECCKQAESAAFVLPTPEDGKYVWRMCIQQHTFYMRRQRALSETHDEPAPNFQEHGLSESREELDVPPARPQPLTLAHRAHSTSCLELDQQHQPPRRALLPSYRPAPDYETAVQQKYQQQRAEAQLRYQNHSHGQLVAAPAKPLVYGSHPDIHRIHYPDVTRHTVSVNQGATDDYAYGLKYMGNYPFPVTPDPPPLHYVNVYKPPPPYPSNGLASNSTPDLAVASQALNYHRGYINSHVSGSSPDLVSTRPALNRQYLGYLNNHVSYGRPVLPSTHGTYNNLASALEPNPHIVIDPHHISDTIQKVYDERGNIMYSMPMHRVPYQRHIVVPNPNQISKLSDAQEPIYENVPLPWQEHKVTMRDRAQSLTTTDEIARLNERNSSHPSINKYLKPGVNAPGFLKVEPDSHYVNAQIIKGVRETSVPRDVHSSNRSINKDEFENVALSVERISLKDDKECDETPYQSLSTHRVSNNTTISQEHVTSINVTAVPEHTAVNSSGEDAAASVSSKEKKRRRWGVFMGRGTKSEVRAATLGRDRDRAPPKHKHRWSTGLPKQPLPPSITKETLCQLLERKMAASQIEFAFERLAKGRLRGGSVATALLPAHAQLNGPGGGALPYDDNRVRLPPTPRNPHGYINASHVTMTVGSTQRFYVVMKVGTGPLSPSGPAGAAAAGAAAAAEAVWQCVWQVGARLVALVGDASRPHYLPKDDATDHYGTFQVTCRASSVARWGMSQRVRVRSGGRARDLWHVHYRNWPADQPAPPDSAEFLSFLSEVNGLRLACAADAAAECGAGAADALWPLAVGCARGAGRCGTALAADLLLHVIDNNQELDIPRTVTMLHQQRANLIENHHQYKFLHRLLLDYLEQSRLI